MCMIVLSMSLCSCSTALEVIGGLAAIAMMPDGSQGATSYYQPTMMTPSNSNAYYTGNYYSSVNNSYASTSGSYSSSTSTSSTKGKMCTLCAGSGQCKTCMGRGYYYSSFNSSTKLSCPNCERNHNGVCSSCHGAGRR